MLKLNPCFEVFGKLGGGGGGAGSQLGVFCQGVELSKEIVCYKQADIEFYMEALILLV